MSRHVRVNKTEGKWSTGFYKARTLLLTSEYDGTLKRGYGTLIRDMFASGLDITRVLNLAFDHLHSLPRPSYDLFEELLTVAIECGVNDVFDRYSKTIDRVEKYYEETFHKNMFYFTLSQAIFTNMHYFTESEYTEKFSDAKYEELSSEKSYQKTLTQDNLLLF